MDNLKPGHKELPSNITVYSGNSKFKYSCPKNMHPDNKKSKTKVRSELKENNDFKGLISGL